MYTLLMILCIIMAILLILAVLIQPGKADMIAGMGGFGGQMSNLFGHRQSRSLLQNITMALTAGLMLTAIVINKTALPEPISGVRGSVLDNAVPSELPAAAPMQQQPQQQPPQQQQPQQQPPAQQPPAKPQGK